jgi:hypothetical protein
MPLRTSIARVVFIASSLLYILCFVVLFSGVCRVPSSESNELHFVSEYISSCLQLPVYNSVPWVLAVAVVASALCVLLNWQEHHACLRYQAGAIHALVFHFCFNIACVVEFRTDGTALIPGYFHATISEASLHKFAALQAILDFVCIHSIISSSACEELEPADARAGGLELRLYRLVEEVYAVFAYIFLVCWIVQGLLVAAIFEWFLVLCAVAMQWFGIRRGALGCTREIEDNKFHLFAGQHSVAILSVYVILNLLSVIAFTPPLMYFGVDAEAHSLRDDAAVSTGPEFWCIVLVSVGAVFLSKSVSTHTTAV